MNENKPIISLFDKDFKIDIDDNIKLNMNDIDSYIEDVKNNFFNIKHDISNLEKFIDTNNHNLKKTLASEVQPNNGCAGLFYDTHYIVPTNDTLKTFNFNFSKTIPFNISASIPEINIYDIPPGIKLLDFIPVVNGSCDYLNTDNPIIFPGLPCALPEIDICYKKLTRRIFGRTITLGIYPYPCGIQQKMIGSITLEPDNTESTPIYTFPKTGLQISGSVYTNINITAEISTNVDVDFFASVVEKFDKALYDSATNNGKAPFKNTTSALRTILSLIKDGGLKWLLKLLRFVHTISEYGLTFALTITSILVDYKINIRNFNAYYGDRNVEINNISYEENNFEILKDGKYISLQLNSNSALSLVLDLGTYTGGNFSEKCNLPYLLSKAIINQIQNLPPSNNSNRFYLFARRYQLNNILNFITSKTNPINVLLLNNITIPINLSIKLCSPLEGIILPEVVGCVSINFVLGDLLKFIKEDMIRIIGKFLSLTKYAEQINADNLQNIISVIPGATIPDDIKSKINLINVKIEQVNNLYLGFVQIALQAAFSVLDKIPSTQFPLTTTIGVCVPII